jgi:hypothetical protein
MTVLARTSGNLAVRQSSACHLLSRWFLVWLILRSWSLRRYIPRKRRLTFNRLHGVISQMIELFIATGARTSKTKLNKLGRKCKHRVWDVWSYL